MNEPMSRRAAELEELFREYDICLVFGGVRYTVHDVIIPEEGHFGNEPMVEVTFGHAGGTKNWYALDRYLGVALQEAS